MSFGIQSMYVVRRVPYVINLPTIYFYFINNTMLSMSWLSALTSNWSHTYLYAKEITSFYFLSPCYDAEPLAVPPLAVHIPLCYLTVISCLTFASIYLLIYTKRTKISSTDICACPVLDTFNDRPIQYGPLKCKKSVKGYSCKYQNKHIDINCSLNHTSVISV